MGLGDAILCVVAVILPPLPVAVKRGVCSCDFLINVLLCLIGFLPGLIHAWWIVLTWSEERQRFEYLQRRRDREEAFVYGAAGQHVHGGPVRQGVQGSTGTFPGVVYVPVAAPQAHKNQSQNEGAGVAANGGPIVDYGATSSSGVRQNEAPPAYTPVGNQTSVGQDKRT